MNNIKKATEHDSYFLMDDGSGTPFKVAKSAISPQLTDRIRRMYCGGAVKMADGGVAKKDQTQEVGIDQEVDDKDLQLDANADVVRGVGASPQSGIGKPVEPVEGEPTVKIDTDVVQAAAKGAAEGAVAEASAQIPSDTKTATAADKQLPMSLDDLSKLEDWQLALIRDSVNKVADAKKKSIVPPTGKADEQLMGRMQELGLHVNKQGIVVENQSEKNPLTQKPVGIKSQPDQAQLPSSPIEPVPPVTVPAQAPAAEGVAPAASAQASVAPAPVSAPAVAAAEAPAAPALQQAKPSIPEASSDYLEKLGVDGRKAIQREILKEARAQGKTPLFKAPDKKGTIGSKTRGTLDLIGKYIGTDNKLHDKSELTSKAEAATAPAAVAAPGVDTVAAPAAKAAEVGAVAPVTAAAPAVVATAPAAAAPVQATAAIKEPWAPIDFAPSAEGNTLRGEVDEAKRRYLQLEGSLAELEKPGETPEEQADKYMKTVTLPQGVDEKEFRQRLVLRYQQAQDQFDTAKGAIKSAIQEQLSVIKSGIEFARLANERIKASEAAKARISRLTQEAQSVDDLAPFAEGVFGEGFWSNLVGSVGLAFGTYAATMSGQAPFALLESVMGRYKARLAAATDLQKAKMSERYNYLRQLGLEESQAEAAVRADMNAVASALLNAYKNNAPVTQQANLARMQAKFAKDSTDLMDDVLDDLATREQRNMQNKLKLMDLQIDDRRLQADILAKSAVIKTNLMRINTQRAKKGLPAISLEQMSGDALARLNKLLSTKGIESSLLDKSVMDILGDPSMAEASGQEPVAGAAGSAATMRVAGAVAPTGRSASRAGGRSAARQPMQRRVASPVITASQPLQAPVAQMDQVQQPATEPSMVTSTAGTGLSMRDRQALYDAAGIPIDLSEIERRKAFDQLHSPEGQKEFFSALTSRPSYLGAADVNMSKKEDPRWLRMVKAETGKPGETKAPAIQRPQPASRPSQPKASTEQAQAPATAPAQQTRSKFASSPIQAVASRPAEFMLPPQKIVKGKGRNQKIVEVPERPDIVALLKSGYAITPGEYSAGADSLNADMKNSAQSVTLYDSSGKPHVMIKLALPGKANKAKSYAQLKSDYDSLMKSISAFAAYVPQKGSDGKYFVAKKRAGMIDEAFGQSELATIRALIQELKRAGSGMGALDEGVRKYFDDLLGNPQPHLYGGNAREAQASFIRWAGTLKADAQNALDNYFVRSTDPNQNRLSPPAQKKSR